MGQVPTAVERWHRGWTVSDWCGLSSRTAHGRLGSSAASPEVCRSVWARTSDARSAVSGQRCRTRRTGLGWWALGPVGTVKEHRVGQCRSSDPFCAAIGTGWNWVSRRSEAAGAPELVSPVSSTLSTGCRSVCSLLGLNYRDRPSSTAAVPGHASNAMETCWSRTAG